MIPDPYLTNIKFLFVMSLVAAGVTLTIRMVLLRFKARMNFWQVIGLLWAVSCIADFVVHGQVYDLGLIMTAVFAVGGDAVYRLQHMRRVVNAFTARAAGAEGAAAGKRVAAARDAS